MGVIMKNSVEYGVNGGVTDVMLNNNSIVEGGIASIPLVSSSTDGAVPAGATVSTQDQTTKFLREDGSWAVPSYTTKTDKANVDGSNITNPAAFRTAIGLTSSTTELTTPASQIFRQFIKRQNGIVYLYLDFNNFTSTTAQTIGYLPEGYRPYHRILTDVIVISADDDSFKGYAHFVIQTTGEITLQMQGSYTHSFCTLNVVFPNSNN